MRTEEEVEIKNNEVMDAIDESNGMDCDPVLIHRVLDWVLEASDELDV